MFVVVAALLTVGVSASPANAWEVACAGEVASHGVAGWGVSGDGGGWGWGEGVLSDEAVWGDALRGGVSGAAEGG